MRNWIKSIVRGIILISLVFTVNSCKNSFYIENRDESNAAYNPNITGLQLSIKSSENESKLITDFFNTNEKNNVSKGEISFFGGVNSSTVRNQGYFSKNSLGVLNLITDGSYGYVEINFETLDISEYKTMNIAIRSERIKDINSFNVEFGSRGYIKDIKEYMYGYVVNIPESNRVADGNWVIYSIPLEKLTINNNFDLSSFNIMRIYTPAKESKLTDLEKIHDDMYSLNHDLIFDLIFQ